MTVKKVKAVYFSPSGTTEKVVKSVCEGLSGQKEYHDILIHKIEKKLSVEQDEVLVVAMPVFGGRVPDYCVSSLKHLHGKNSPAIIMAVYGNREFDDTLVEMQDILEKNDFLIIGGAGFIAQHSLFNKIAAGRPDEEDMKAMMNFAAQCQQKLDTFVPEKTVTPEIPGNRPYKEYMKNTMTPEGSKACTKCRTCVQICPVGAIGSETPRKTNKNKCISCTACVAHCPTGARSFSGPIYSVMQKKISGHCAEKKEAKVYILSEER